MGKINLSNIQASLNRAKETAAPLQNKGHTENVPVDFIHLAESNVYNENDTDESIKELADNIEACGLLHPIAVHKISSYHYQIISGERRYRAITEYLHWKSIPCMVFEGLSKDSAQLKLYMANLAVREYTSGQRFKYYIEVKELLGRMAKSGEYTGGLQKGIAEILNVTERQIRKYAQLEKMPLHIQQDVIDGKISINKAIEMASDKSDSNSENLLMEKLLSNLTSEQKSILLSGEIDLPAILSKKAEPVPIVTDTSTAFDGKAEKAESVPIVSDTSTTFDGKAEKAEPVPIVTDTSTTFDGKARKAEPVPIVTDTSTTFNGKAGKAEPVPNVTDTSTTFNGKAGKAEPVPIVSDTSTAFDGKIEKAEPVPIVSDTSTAFDGKTEKAEPVPIVTDTSMAFGGKAEKAEPVPIVTDTSMAFGGKAEKAEPVPIVENKNAKGLQDGSMIFYKNGHYVPNKIQVMEEHEQYTVFKVFAVKQ